MTSLTAFPTVLIECVRVCVFAFACRFDNVEEVDCRWSLLLFCSTGWENGADNWSKHWNRKRDQQRVGSKRFVCSELQVCGFWNIMIPGRTSGLPQPASVNLRCCTGKFPRYGSGLWEGLQTPPPHQIPSEKGPAMYSLTLHGDSS